MLKLDKPLLEVVDSLEPRRVELRGKLSAIFFSETRRRLIEFEFVKKNMEEKYGMSLKEFEKKKMIDKLGYTEQVENDYMTWDSAVDGIKTMKKIIKKLEGFLSAY